MFGVQKAPASNAGSQAPVAGPSANCRVEFAGRFCPKCGEKRVDPHEYSLAHFGEHALESFTHFDFKSFRTLKLPVSRPGFLTREYLDGRRKPYVAPIQLFVIVNIAFAILISFTGWTPLNTRLRTHENMAPMRVAKREIIAEKIAESGLTRTEFERSFNAAADVSSKTWVFSMIPIFAVIVALIYGRRHYFFAHLLFSTHFYTFFLIVLLAGVYSMDWIIGPIAGWLFVPMDREIVSSLLSVTAVALYMFLALRRTYGDSARSAALRAVVLTAAMIPILFGYRFLLFFVTLRSMH